MQIAQKLSGFTAGQADILRRAMGKKKRVELEKQKLNFINGAVENGISKDVAAGIFLKIEPFAEYGFNKSHAAAYAIISYQTAFLKTYYPKEFIAASMTMDISNQNKLNEFYEELKRLGVDIIRPNINECFADFRTKNDKFFYALGGIKAVGYEAISNIINERLKNGKFNSISDFINRVNPRDINKLQLEGLVKAGAFDDLNSNRQSLFNSISNFIIKSKSIYENKSNNQIELFQENESQRNELTLNVDDWKFEERLSKEFEAVGFFISNHPLNQYKSFFDDFKIIDFNKFNSNLKPEVSNIAGTLLKIQERKTAKGNSYAVLKLTDLNSVFELFIFSDTLEMNREILKEGHSLLLTLSKSIANDNNRLTRINVQKIISLKNLFEKPISEVTFTVKSKDQIERLSKVLNKKGNTKISIELQNNKNTLFFELENPRKVDYNSLNLLKNDEIYSIMS